MDNRKSGNFGGILRWKSSLNNEECLNRNASKSTTDAQLVERKEAVLLSMTGEQLLFMRGIIRLLLRLRKSSGLRWFAERY